MRILSISGLASTLMLGGLLGLSGPLAASDPYLDLAPCELHAAGGRLTFEARCGQFTVPENPAEPEGRQIELAYAVVPARGRQRQADPLFFLAGGPGQSAREAAPIMRLALREINRSRDLIFLDQRGTGGSNKLDCDFGDTTDWMQHDFDQINRQLQRCAQDWEADVRFYTTTHAADDIEALRQRYGFEQINLLGGSYGTRLAQVYLRRYPDRVRRVVLDGVVPMRLALGEEHGPVLDQALYRLFEECNSDAACRDAFPSLVPAFDSLVRHYQTVEQNLTLTHPRTGQGMDLLFNRDTLASGLRFLAYSPQSQMMIPYLVHEAATTGDPSRLATQAVIVTEEMDEMIAIGLNFAVGCSEDWPVWDRSRDHSYTLLGNAMRDFYEAVCDWWPAGEVAENFHQPFDAPAPVLLLSGEFDPVTPPDYGEEAAEAFSQSRHLVGRGLAHIISTHPCFSGIVADFISGTELDALDTACMDRLSPEPFFINLLGPTP
ncbi:MAG: alpha/beta hydrolase [Wenzhouxiangella sp.]